MLRDPFQLINPILMDRVQVLYSLIGEQITPKMIEDARRFGFEVNPETRSISIINPTKQEKYAITQGLRATYPNHDF